MCLALITVQDAPVLLSVVAVAFAAGIATGDLLTAGLMGWLQRSRR